MSKEHIRLDNCTCGSCNICCLFVCKDCGLYEGALTTHCSGVIVTMDNSNLIYKGELNYRGNIWIKECSEHTPAFFHKYNKEFQEQHNITPTIPK